MRAQDIDLNAAQARLEERQRELGIEPGRPAQPMPRDPEPELSEALAEMRAGRRPRLTAAQVDERRRVFRQQIAERMPEALRQSGVPLRLRELEIDDALIPEAAHRWLGTAPKGGSLLLAGPPGTGKTTTSVWCARQYLHQGDVEHDPEEWDIRAVTWRGWGDVRFRAAGALYRAVFQRDRKALSDAERAGLLILDDFGASYEHDWPVAEMDLLIDARWSERRPTIVTTNLYLDAGMARSAGVDESWTFESRYPRIYSRLCDADGPGAVVLSGRDLRQAPRGRRP